MTAILSISPHIAVITFFFLLILLLYNGLMEFYWFWQIKHNYSNTKYEHKKLRYYKKKIIIISPIIMILGLMILFYKAPIPFEKIVSLEEQQNVDVIDIRGNLPNDNKSLEITDSNISELLKGFNDYKYRRCFGGNYRGKVVFMDMRTDDYRWTDLVTVWDSGYITMPDNEIYKVLSQEESELFNKITKLLE